jgi:hypothetical protein
MYNTMKTQRVRQKITPDINTIAKLLHETYNDIAAFDGSLKKIIREWSEQIDSFEKIAIIGNQINGLLDKKDKAINTKLRLADALLTVYKTEETFKNSGSKVTKKSTIKKNEIEEETQSNGVLSDNTKKELRDMIKNLNMKT